MKSLVMLFSAVVLALAGCSRPAVGDLRPPTAIPSPTQPVATQTPFPTASPTEPAATPTEPSPELGQPVDLPPLAPGAEVQIQRIVMVDEETGWAVGGVGAEDGRLLRTADGGTTWQDISPPTFFAEGGTDLRTSAAFLGAERAWVVRYTPIQGEPADVPLVVWRTSDGGVSWNPGQARRVPFIGSAYAEPYVVFSSAQDGWLLGRLGGAGMHQYPVALYATHDGGASWQVLTEPFGERDAGLMSCHKSGMAFGENGLGLLTIDSCPITGAEVQLTEDGGRTWTPITLPEPDGYPGLYDQGTCESHSPAVLDGGEMVVGVLCRTFDGGQKELPFIYRSEDAGRSWTTLEAAPGQLTFLSPEVLWATDHDLHRSLDGGRTWTMLKTVSWQGQFSFVSEDLGWAVARAEDELALVKTENGGRTWALLKPVIAP